MKKIALLATCFFIVNIVFCQKMMTRKGEIKFEANVPSFEPVAATNKSVSSILDESSGELVVLALVKEFKFRVPLMEEHFNENYIESSRYPKATFKGKILNFDASKLSSEKKRYDVEGELTLHGVTKKVKTNLALASNAGKVMLTCNFDVKPQDFKIEIPSIVKNKIAEKVTIAVNFVLEAK